MFTVTKYMNHSNEKGTQDKGHASKSAMQEVLNQWVYPGFLNKQTHSAYFLPELISENRSILKENRYSR